MKNFILTISFVLLICCSGSLAQDITTGGVKGTVKNIKGNKLSGVTVEARQNGNTVATARSDSQGDFTIANLKPGLYRFVFNKTGLSEGVSGEIEVKAKTNIKLSRLIMDVDKGILAFVRGSVFDAEGRIVRGAKIEIFKINGDSLKKMGERYSDDNGEFAIRLPPESSRYRISANRSNENEPTSKDFEFTGGEVFRIALTLKSKK